MIEENLAGTSFSITSSAPSSILYEVVTAFLLLESKVNGILEGKLITLTSV